MADSVMLRKAMLLVVAHLFAGSIFWPAAASAECVFSTAASEFDRAAQVFVGDVSSVEYVESRTPLGLRPYVRVRFRLIESFKGPDDRERTLDFVIISESYVFAGGQRVLVYAAPYETGWSTWCSPTRRANIDDSSEFDLLRQLSKGAALQIVTTANRQSLGPPHIAPFFTLVDESPAFFVECRNDTREPLSADARIWPSVADGNLRLDGQPFVPSGGYIGSGLVSTIQPGGTWRGIIALHQAANRPGAPARFGAMVRIGHLVPLEPGRHTIAVRCGDRWSEDLEFFWEDDTGAPATDAPFQASFIPEAGMVPDAEAAIRIAEAVWLPVYGADISTSKPFRAELRAGVWYVQGTLPPNVVGGVPHARIDQRTGAVRGIMHTQ